MIPASNERPRTPLGTLILRAGLLSEEQITDALREGDRTGRRLGEILVQRGLLGPVDLARMLAHQTNLPFVKLEDVPLDRHAVRLVTEEAAIRNRVLPYGFEGGMPIVAIADPTDNITKANLHEALNRDFRLTVTTEADLAAAIARAFGRQPERSAQPPSMGIGGGLLRTSGAPPAERLSTPSSNGAQHDPAPSVPPHGPVPSSQQHDPMPAIAQDDRPPTALHDDPVPSSPQHDPVPSSQQHDLAPSVTPPDPAPTALQHDPVPSSPQHDPVPRAPQHDPAPSVTQLDRVPTAQQLGPAPTFTSPDPAPSVVQHDPVPSAPAALEVPADPVPTPPRSEAPVVQSEPGRTEARPTTEAVPEVDVQPPREDPAPAEPAGGSREDAGGGVVVPLWDGPLGSLLVSSGVLSAEQVEDALRDAARRGRRLGEVVLERGWIGERTLANCLATQKGVPFVSLDESALDYEAINLLPEEIALRYGALPLRLEDGGLKVAIADPTNEAAMASVRSAVEVDVHFVVAALSEVGSALARAYGDAGAATDAPGPGDVGSPHAKRVGSADAAPELSVPELPPAKPEPQPTEPELERAPAPVDRASSYDGDAREAPRPTFRVLVRLSQSERVEVGTFPNLRAAEARAKEFMRQIADHGPDEWPFVSGRFLRPEAIVSVDIAESSDPADPLPKTGP